MNEELAVVEEPQNSMMVLPAINAEGMRQAMAAYTSICEAVLTEDDYQTVWVNEKQKDGSYRKVPKTFKKKSAWQKLAVAFAVSTAITDHRTSTDDKGVLTAEFTVRATAPNGRFADGWAACSSDERKSDKPSHDIPATAETRARNRACSNLFAFGEVSAEEMTRMGKPDEPPPIAAPIAPPQTLEAPKPRGPRESTTRVTRAVPGPHGHLVTVSDAQKPFDAEDGPEPEDTGEVREPTISELRSSAESLALSLASRRHPEWEERQLTETAFATLEKAAGRREKQYRDLDTTELQELIIKLTEMVEGK